MIALSPDDRAAVDAGITASLARIEERARSLGDGAAELAGAMTRVTDGGKRWRPALVVAAYRAFGGTSDPSLFPVATAFELLHTAFVVHDDVIDRDTVRRGVPNVSGEFRARALARGADDGGAALLGDAAGILAGDLLLHEATRLIARAPLTETVRTELLDVLDDAILVSAVGELADVEHAVAGEHADADAILAASHRKTAVYSFTAPLRSGALLAGASAPARDAVAVVGDRIGLAFQLVDDLIGAFGTEAQAGKPAGADLREAKRTPIVALARESKNWPQVSDALALAWTGPVALLAAQEALEGSGARDGLLALIDRTLGDARAAAESPDLPPAVTALAHALCRDVEKRVP